MSAVWNGWGPPSDCIVGGRSVEAREPVTVGRPLHGVRTCVMSADSERMQLHHNNFVHARAYHEYRLAVHDADCRI